MNRYEYIQYEIAEAKLQDLKEEHNAELRHAYDSIHPTRSQTDYGVGQIYVESICPATYAAYLVDMQAEHKEKESYWVIRSKLFKKAVDKLSEQESSDLQGVNGHAARANAQARARNIMGELVVNYPELQRDMAARELAADVERHDKEVEGMSNKELLEGYEDVLHDDRTKDRCIDLYESYGMKSNGIAEYLGITKKRVNGILRPYRAKKREKAEENAS